ncbi:hypothetical protein AVEN_176998-1, partial [Araneus ventricosus]
MLLVMLINQRCHIRTLAARRIIKAREIGPDGNTDFGATDCVDLIDWQAHYVAPPPVLRQTSSYDLLKMI